MLETALKFHLKPIKRIWTVGFCFCTSVATRRGHLEQTSASIFTSTDINHLSKFFVLQINRGKVMLEGLKKP